MRAAEARGGVRGEDLSSVSIPPEWLRVLAFASEV